MDHLQLPPAQPLESRRARGNPIPERIVPRVRHGAELAERLDEVQGSVEAGLVADEDETVPIVLKIRANTRLSSGPFTRMRFTPLGEGDDWTYFVLSTRESRELFLSILGEYGQLPDGASAQVDWSHPKSWAQFIDHIDGIELYGPDDRRSPTIGDLDFNPIDAVDLLLWPSPSDRIAAERVNALVDKVNQHSGVEPMVRVAAVDPRPESTLVRVMCTEPLLDELLHEAIVERARAPLRAAITQAEVATARMPDHVPDIADTRIGIVDGVINLANPLTGPYVKETREFPDGHTFAGPDSHGTAVAGCAIWGDLDQLVAGELRNRPHPVVSARVLDATPLGDYRVNGLAHVTIENAVRWLATDGGAKIVNVSINAPVAADSALRDELTATVDQLVRELGIVIVVSTGNRIQPPADGWLNGYPNYLKDEDARIAAPGDAALAVTVGSYAKRDKPGGPFAQSKVPIAGQRRPSPFTRCGPTRGVGRVGTLKPEFVHHGGNWSWDHMTSRVDPREPGTAAIVAIPPQSGRIVGSDTGTSYAAPAVAHEIARIRERYPEAGHNLLRALTGLSARPIDDPFSDDNAVEVAGYGEPNADRVLESGPQRVFLVYEGVIESNSAVIHRIPIPAEFAAGVRRRTFRVALAFDPPVRRARREYVAGRMTVELVRGLSEAEVRETYSRQPSRAQLAEDDSLQWRPLPDAEHRPPMEPGISEVDSNTLIRRDYINGTWDPDHRDYFLVIAHNQSRWTAAQRAGYPEQRYALAVEITEEGASDLNLYQAVQTQIRARARARV